MMEELHILVYGSEIIQRYEIQLSKVLQTTIQSPEIMSYASVIWS